MNYTQPQNSGLQYPTQFSMDEQVCLVDLLHVKNEADQEYRLKVILGTSYKFVGEAYRIMDDVECSIMELWQVRQLTYNENYTENALEPQV